ncbi:MAG: triose-phosphate isomerase [Patescibacteria group bacterium]
MKSIVVANWKMNPATFKEAKKLFEATRKAAESAKNVSVIVAPPAIFLRELSVGYKGKRLSFAAQNAHYEAGGAFTGEMSMTQAKDAKVSYVLVGHGERRAQGETNEDTRKKMFTALQLKISPILCVGEKERVADGDHFHIVREQIRTGLADIVVGKLKQVVIMYEPLWAVGSGNPVTPRNMHEMFIFIKKTLVEMYGEAGMAMRILYGGSVTDSNAAAMILEAGVQGFVVGGASLDPEKFKALVDSIETVA